MNKILDKMNSTKNLEDNDIRNIYDLLNQKVESCSENGINYSEIAKFAFDNDNDNGTNEYFYKNIDTVKQYAKNKQNKDVKEYLDKIKNHVELETCRLNHLEKKQKKELLNMISATLTNVQTMNDKLNTHDNNIEKYSKEINNWYANIITILGLFAAIVVTFFGGLGSIGSIFSNINAISKYRLIFIILIVIFAMFNIVFMLLYYIAMITNKSLNKDCSIGCKKINQQNGEETVRRSRDNNLNNSKTCSLKKSTCSLRRYPLIITFNILISIMMFGTVVIYFITKYIL